eukprot:jgi/Galph1/3633/GphlegSOOS_G2267.1
MDCFLILFRYSILEKKSYLSLCGLTGVSAWCFLSIGAHSVSSAVAAAVLSSVSVAFSDVVVDSILVEQVRGQSQQITGNLQSLCWGSSAVGGLLSSYFSGSLLTTLQPRHVFLLTALFPFATLVASLFIDEQRTTLVDKNWMEIGKKYVGLLKNTLGKPQVWKPVCFVFLWQSTPNTDTAMMFFQTQQLHFTPEILGTVRFVSSIALLLGVLLYQRFLKSIPIKKVLITATLLSFPLGMTQLILVMHWNRCWGIPDVYFALGDSVVLSVLGQVSFMPILVLAARLCPPGVEGILFAMLMFIFNSGGILSTELGALLMNQLDIRQDNFDNLWLLLTLCNLSSLFPLFFSPFLNDVDRVIFSNALDRQSYSYKPTEIIHHMTPTTTTSHVSNTKESDDS